MAAAPAVIDGWRRLSARGRLGGVDLARGLAVIGMLAAHLLWIPEWSWDDPSTWVDIANGRSSILFAVLAGVSIALVTGGTHRISDAALRIARGRIAVRALLVWMLGLVLIATGVPVYVILPAYAILFLLALPLLRFRAGPLLAIAGVLAVVTPFVYAPLAALPFWQTASGDLLDAVIGWHYPFVVWVSFIVAGLGIGRLDLRSLRVQGALLGAGVAAAVIGYGLDAAQIAPAGAWQTVFTAAAHSSGVYEVLGSGGFAIAVLAACLLLCRTPLTWIVLPLRAVGSMPLTAYTAQLVVWAIWAAGTLESVGDLAGFRDLQPFWPMTLGLLVGCTAWALTLGRGPLEWAFDRAARSAVRGGRS